MYSDDRRQALVLMDLVNEGQVEKAGGFMASMPPHALSKTYEVKYYRPSAMAPDTLAQNLKVFSVLREFMLGDQVALFERAVALGADVNERAPSMEGYSSLLHEAVALAYRDPKKVDWVRRLLTSGARVDAGNVYFHGSPLAFLLNEVMPGSRHRVNPRHLDNPMIALLLASGCSWEDASTHYWGQHTPLMAAVHRHDLSMVRGLLEKGASPNGVNKRGETALVTAFKAVTIPKKIIVALLKKGAVWTPETRALAQKAYEDNHPYSLRQGWEKLMVILEAGALKETLKGAVTAAPSPSVRHRL